MIEIKSKFFYPYNLNKNKHNLIIHKAFTLRLYRNFISKEIFHYLKINKKMPNIFEFGKIYTKEPIKGLINKDMESAIRTVFSNYENKFKKKFVKHFFIKAPDQISYYKKATKLHKKGDVLKIERKTKQTELSIIVNFFLFKNIKNKEEAIDLISYIINNNEIKNNIKDLYQFYLNIIERIDKDKLNRLFKLAESRSSRHFKKVWNKQILYSSLSFNAQSRIVNEILDKNKNKQSKINSFINLGAYFSDKSNKLHIPIKTVKNYHSGIFVKSYSITFIDNVNFRIELVTRKESKFKFNNNTDKVLGVDLNIKHNLFSTSTGKCYDLDKNLKKEGIELLKKSDKYKNSKYLKFHKAKYRRKMIYETNKLISNLLLDCLKNGIRHISLENLNIVGNGLKSKNKELDFSYGRLASFLNLDSMKLRVRKQAHNKGISVSFVPSEFTSQKCNKCNHISKGNRKTQENFKCEKCGYEINADKGSARNIKAIVTEDVLREAFLEIDLQYNEYNVRRGVSKDFVRITYQKLFSEGNT